MALDHISGANAQLSRHALEIGAVIHNRQFYLGPGLHGNVVCRKPTDAVGCALNAAWFVSANNQHRARSRGHIDYLR